MSWAMSGRPARYDNGLPGGEPGMAPGTSAGSRVVRVIIVNGERRSTAAATVDELLAESGYGGAKVATALNGDFVPARARSGKRLADGDQIEIVAPRQGG